MLYSSSVQPTKLRENLYGILDQVLESGQPVQIERKGRVLTLSAQPATSRMALLKPHPGAVVGDPEDIVSIDWSQSWNPGV
jgi:hypothetical protein